ncbi:MAG: DNA replication and repair protein RecF [Firmicutes bacterium]|nr:DNA replication and repair protein RecF [Bacillota bacterium]
MKIDKLQVREFRNLAKIDYYPGPGLNVFVGDNAQGKTSLLESIYVLATGTSFRTATDANLVKYDADGYLISSIYQSEARILEAQMQYHLTGSKIMLINNKKCAYHHPDRLRVVLFTPDDLFLIKGSPAKRRAFLDFILKQLSAEYAHDLDNYATILRKRNLLLKKEQNKGKTFDITTDIFIENAARLIIQRINFVNLLDEISRGVYQDINQGVHELKTRYALSFAVDSDKINMDVLKTALLKKVEEKRSEEINRRKTLVGPHLDDINFYQDGRLARTFASQGQQRNMAISLKLAEIYAFKRIKDVYPVFLLDEVLAELDEGKRRLLIQHLQEADFQTFLTAVKIDHMDKETGPISMVREGVLLRKEFK